MSYAYPEDENLKLLIDRIANNVVQNGSQLANHILQKEAGNPRFSFLIPGAQFNDYYEFQKNVAIQQRQQQQPQQPQQQPMATNVAPANPLAPRIDIEGMKKQIESMKAQVAESNKNVEMQKHVLTTQLESQMDQLYLRSQTEKIDKFVKESMLDMTGLHEILNKNSYSSEVVSAGRHWISDHCKTDKQKEVVFLYLLFRTKTSSLDSPIRLLIVYIADELAGKNLHRSTIGRYIAKFYAYATESRIPKVKEKLDRCLNYWEKYSYFDAKCIQACKNMQQTLANERAFDVGEINALRNQIDLENRKKIDKYEKQNAEFAAHINAQIGAFEATIENENRRIQMLTAPQEISPTVPYYCLPAGVCVNMVKLEDFSYKPLKVKDIKIPNRVATTERLTQQITRFYSIMPEASLDEQGWEIDGLKYHYDAKNAAKKAMEAALIDQGQGKKIEDLYTNRYKSPSPDADALRKTRFDIKPKEKPPQPSSQFQYSYNDEPKESSKTTSSTYDNNGDDDDMPDYSRSGFGSGISNTSSVNKPNTAAPMFGKPISFSFSTNPRR